MMYLLPARTRSARRSGGIRGRAPAIVLALLPAAALGAGGRAEGAVFPLRPTRQEGVFKAPSGVLSAATDPDRVLVDYGKTYVLECDGTDICSPAYAWRLGRGGDQPVLLPRYARLGRGPRSPAPSNGWIDIDPAAGLVRFAPAFRVDAPERLRFRKMITLGNLTTWRVRVKGSVAYCVGEEETHAIQPIDFRDPAHPRYLPCARMGGYPFDLVLGASHAYAFTTGDAFLVAEISEAKGAREVRVVPCPKASRGALDGDRLLVSGDHGTFIYDVSREEDPRLMALDRGTAGCAKIEVRGDRVVALFDLPAAGRDGEQGEGSVRLVTYAFDRGGAALRPRGELELQGTVGRGWNSKRGSLLLTDRVAFAATTRALYLVEYRGARPRIYAALPEYASRTAYWGKGSGALDMAAAGDRLYIAAGSSRWREGMGLTLADLPRRHDFGARRFLYRRPFYEKRIFLGGVHILDVSDPLAPRRVAVVDDAWLGFGCITNVAVSGTTLVACARDVGLIFVDIADPADPRYLSVISTNGEVEYARPLGDRVYAVGNGVYTIDPDAPPGREYLDFCHTDTWMFGGFILGNPLPRYNPRGLFYAAINDVHRELIQIGDGLRVRDYEAARKGRGQWVGEYLYSPLPFSDPKSPPFGIEVWRLDAEGRTVETARAECPVAVTHLVRHDRYLFGLALRHGEEVGPYLAVFDVRDPLRPVLVATLRGPIDAGCMRSSDPYYYRGFLFLPGWLAMAKRLGGGLGGFPGIRVIDVRDPLRPRAHALINHFPLDRASDALVSAQNFHAEGDTLYVADYWSGIHVFDIRDLAEKGTARHIATVKHDPQPWSAVSYATSVAGRGNRLYSTHFGELKVWDIPCASDVPAGALRMRVLAR